MIMAQSKPRRDPFFKAAEVSSHPLPDRLQRLKALIGPLGNDGSLMSPPAQAGQDKATPPAA